jgi:hypothetical protein
MSFMLFEGISTVLILSVNQYLYITVQWLALLLYIYEVQRKRLILGPEVVYLTRFF